MCFVDLEKAFDRVPRGILWEVLWEYGVRGLLLRAVRSLYNRSRSLVRIASCKSDLFPVHVGLRRGCPLSPVLFIVFMDRISRRSQGLEGVRFGDHRISSLIFADDVVLLASSGLDLQHALGRFAAECEAAGMRVSTSKSEATVLDRKKVACTLQVRGEVLPQVEEFKYLRVLFTSEGRMDREIDRRIGAAAAVMRSMYRSVVVKKELSRKAKLLIYQSIYAPTLTYDHELWVMTERVRSRLQAAKTSFLRRVAGRSLRDRVRSSVTREELGVEPLLLHIERGQLRWLGHLFRMPPGRLPGEVFRACPTGKRPRGRPRTCWRDYVFRLAWERLGVPPEELEEVAREREPQNTGPAAAYHWADVEMDGDGMGLILSRLKSNLEPQNRACLYLRQFLINEKNPSGTISEISVSHVLRNFSEAGPKWKTAVSVTVDHQGAANGSHFASPDGLGDNDSGNIIFTRSLKAKLDATKKKNKT
ncbi:hypothetical protein QTP86_006191 [Hemibagrus guttatus]|nr:hypothetical protein QTP86_006191 [Hemibagrus guttatus]